ncbi:MAG: cell envelope integrity protein CreD [Proteobacteria bacterium]|nr:MAG: cell envelope integrity protein CreD [Pseudomonadota bacterium]
MAVLGTVSERSERRDQVYKEMAHIIAGSQVIAGPILVMPYELHTQRVTVDGEGIKQTNLEVIKREQFILPKHLTIDGDMKVERRWRSLYEILLYGSQLKLKGDFNFTSTNTLSAPSGSTVHKLQPYLVVMIKDSRGLTTIPLVSWNNKEVPVKAGLNGLTLKSGGGFYIDLPSDVQSGGDFSFNIDMYVRGTQSFGWIPVGEESKVKIQSNWPHPSFQGLALPKKHSILDQGFNAEWDSTHFSTNVAQSLGDHLDPLALEKQEVGIKLVQPVDIYQQAERSVKYGFLIIALTFAAFLAFETIKQLSIHPIQYAFVGLALVIFYVLLLALSEHISFARAYLVASIASISLLGFYLRFVLHSWKHAISFAISLALLNSVTYGILISEDYALLYGSILLFSLLALAMIVTRKVDWNTVGLGTAKTEV